MPWTCITGNLQTKLFLFSSMANNIRSAQPLYTIGNLLSELATYTSTALSDFIYQKAMHTICYMYNTVMNQSLSPLYMSHHDFNIDLHNGKSITAQCICKLMALVMLQ